MKRIKRKKETTTIVNLDTLASLDVGFSNTGYVIWNKGVIINVGVIGVKKDKKKGLRKANERSRRAGELANGLALLICKYNCKAIIGELPTEASRNANAGKDMSAATAVVSSVGTLLGLPMEWCSPNDVKMEACGNLKATKDEIMTVIAEKYKLSTTTKIIKIEKGPRVGETSEQKSFLICGKWWPKTRFEHIADAIVVYSALKNENLVKIFG